MSFRTCLVTKPKRKPKQNPPAPWGDQYLDWLCAMLQLFTTSLASKIKESKEATLWAHSPAASSRVLRKDNKDIAGSHASWYIHPLRSIQSGWCNRPQLLRRFFFRRHVSLNVRRHTPPPNFKMSTRILTSCRPVSLGVVGEAPSSLTSPSIISNSVILQTRSKLKKHLSKTSCSRAWKRPPEEDKECQVQWLGSFLISHSRSAAGFLVQILSVSARMIVDASVYLVASLKRDSPSKIMIMCSGPLPPLQEKAWIR